MSLSGPVLVGQFDGPGGWSTGAELLGLGPAVGYEWDRSAVRTARAAGHVRVQIDVTEVGWEELVALRRPGLGMTTSPPCQAYSRAGQQLGREDVDRIMAHLALVAERGEWVDYRDRSDAIVDLWGEPAVDHSTWADPRSALVLEAVRWQLALQPEWIAAEQVPDVLPFWQAWGEYLRTQGYSVWTGVLSAEQYGVPQTRKRAILIASRTREVHEPAPTHRRYHPRTGNVPGDEHLAQWVSMGQALGVERGAVGFPRQDDRGGDGYRERDFRSTDEPSFTLTEKARSWSRWVYRNGNQARSAERELAEPAPTIHFGNALNEVRWLLRPSVSEKGTAKPVPRDLDQPAATVTGKHRSAEWVHDRPATTVQGDPRVWPPGHKVNGDDRERLGAELADELYGDRAGTDAIKVTVEQAACLQSFPVGYPWVGVDTARYRQVGDAIPPLLACAILGVATGREAEAARVCLSAYGQEVVPLP